jgi:hypothetical protein
MVKNIFNIKKIKFKINKNSFIRLESIFIKIE